MNVAFNPRASASDYFSFLFIVSISLQRFLVRVQESSVTTLCDHYISSASSCLFHLSLSRHPVNLYESVDTSFHVSIPLLEPDTFNQPDHDVYLLGLITITLVEQLSWNQNTEFSAGIPRGPQHVLSNAAAT
eukprot:GHVU01047917.1.p1 GENE.GHVU01047917.1~~GHVU01047917.1.p1  ORF type:complete len:132 (-),score=2.90 GHVU01047917.1:124-519(-)